MFHLFTAFAEFERHLIEERPAARASGRLGGRTEKFGPKAIVMMKSLIESGTLIQDVAGKWVCLARRFIAIWKNLQNKT